jgi:DNA polymerase-1
MNRLLLIDGNAIMHRAFHALPPLTNSKGETVNAVYGFFSMLLTVIPQIEATHLVVCFDRAKPTFRQTLYVGYQQHRPKMSDDLSPQFVIVHDLLAAMQAQIFELDGYEADDLIGTISVQALKESEGQSGETEVVILSGDRDLLQLVNGQVKMLAPVTGVKNTILYDSAKVVEKFGVKPAQIVDYKALIGDASDGYPGVAGIGPKTASTLLAKYETLEGIYSHLGDLEEKLRDKLVAGSEQAALCKKLATIVTDAPITFRLEKCLFDNLAILGLDEAFAAQGFKSIRDRLKTVFRDVLEKQKSGQLGLLE